jgi:predicted CoA-binding protein
MSDNACPLPGPHESDEDAVIQRLLGAKRIAVVGLSDNPSRASYGVAAYLKSAGKEILPVNPNHQQVMGLKCYASLNQVPGPVDLVDVFRRPEYCPDVVRQAIEIGAKGVWLQSGIHSSESEAIAKKAGIDFVQDRCLLVEHMFGRR